MDNFDEIANDLMTKLSTLADGKTIVSLSDNVHRATLDVIGKVGCKPTLILLTFVGVKKVSNRSIKETKLKMLIPRELLNISKNGNHRMLRHGVFFLLTTRN